MDQAAKYRIVLIRHGESQWNKENRFTGWTDVGLCESGVLEAREAGQLLKSKNYGFDVCFTSILKRSVVTFNLIAEEMDLHHIPVIKSWRLNERHYGALQGLNKAETATLHGEDQVKIWRRSYDTRPPALEATDPRFPGLDPKYKDIPSACLPKTECLLDTVNRVLPFWFDEICRAMQAGKRVLVCAHGNSLRAIIKYLDGISDAEITELNLPTAVPLVYELDADFKPIKHYYLADEEELRRKMAAVATQGKAK